MYVYAGAVWAAKVATNAPSRNFERLIRKVRGFGRVRLVLGRRADFAGEGLGTKRCLARVLCLRSLSRDHFLFHFLLIVKRRAVAARDDCGAGRGIAFDRVLPIHDSNEWAELPAVVLHEE